MTVKEKKLITKRIYKELCTKIGPLFDVLYTVIVVLISFYILLPHLPTPTGSLLTAILLLSGLRLERTGNKIPLRGAVIALLKMFVKTLDKR
jgi:hypothetical protein